MSEWLGGEGVVDHEDSTVESVVEQISIKEYIDRMKEGQNGVCTSQSRPLPHCPLLRSSRH
jgi:hypothetical protein